MCRVLIVGFYRFNYSSQYPFASHLKRNGATDNRILPTICQQQLHCFCKTIQHKFDIEVYIENILLIFEISKNISFSISVLKI